MAFHLEFTHLSPDNIAWGEVALIPWDAAIFGFPVGTLKGADWSIVANQAERFMADLAAWAAAHNVEVVSCEIAASNTHAMALLPLLGFQFVDCKIEAQHRRLQRQDLPATRFPIRLAQPADVLIIQDIAERVFEFGRYITDYRFPQALANRRYRQWITNALAAPADNQVYVAGEPGDVIAFHHVVVNGETADLRLSAVDAERQAIGVGFYLYNGSLQILKDQGVRAAYASVSPANVAVMNIYASLGFQFSQPTLVYHWHRPNSTSLVNIT